MEVEETEHIMKETPEVMDVMVIRTVLNLMSGYFIYNTLASCDMFSMNLPVKVLTKICMVD